MKRRILLRKTIRTAWTGDAGGFENFYILTVQETYGKLRSLVKEPEAAELLKQVYGTLYRQAGTLPLEEGDLRMRIEDEIYRAAGEYLGDDLSETVLEEMGEPLSEEQAATIWLELEEQEQMNREEEEELGGWQLWFFSSLRIAVALMALVLTGTVLYLGGRWLLGSTKETRVPAETAAYVGTETVSPELVGEDQNYTPGWTRHPDGKLYYVMHSGEKASGSVFIGKQQLTFSKTGELTMIGTNREVAENEALCFDEDVRYEVKNGNIYRKDSADSPEQCVVKNGHVVQADIRCGYLWYISEYPVSETSGIRTVVNRAQPDGTEATEVFETGNTLETEGFQVTEKWLYYKSDGKLFRTSLENRATQYLADEVEYYFAWEDTAYYMDGRTLEMVSSGQPYSGMEAGFRIEKQGNDFQLYNSQGGPALESGNGEVRAGDRFYRLENGKIASVRPAERKSGDIHFGIENSGSERKIYWVDGSGRRSLLPQEGIAADSLCLAGNWLYYSARLSQYGGECDSQIYRLNVQTMEQESVGSPFRGHMRNLYYYEYSQCIYGEYIPTVADPDAIHGQIAQITSDGIRVVNDTPVRPKHTGSDMLELVMAGEDRIYCLYHVCSYDSVSGQMAWESTRALEIDATKPGTHS